MTASRYVGPMRCPSSHPRPRRRKNAERDSIGLTSQLTTSRDAPSPGGDTRRHLNVKAKATAAPAAPPAAMTVTRPATWAAATAARKAAPYPAATPTLAMPMARPRRPSGTLTANAVLAAI